MRNVRLALTGTSVGRPRNDEGGVLFIPGTPKECLEWSFICYIKPTKKHSLGSLGVLVYGVLMFFFFFFRLVCFPVCVFFGVLFGVFLSYVY